MNDTTNFAMSHPNHFGKSAEQICMTCGTKFFSTAVLGDDNVYRALPAWCRKYDVAVKIKEPIV